MKIILLILGLALPTGVFAGGDVPWPLALQQDINFKDLQGLWVSVHQRYRRALVYDIQVLETSLISCPYSVMVSEIDSLTGRVKTSGSRLYCKGDRELKLTLFDNEGRARNSLNMVGLVKKTSLFSNSYQYLGMTMVDYNKGHRLTQDVFYKHTF